MKFFAHKIEFDRMEVRTGLAADSPVTVFGQTVTLSGVFDIFTGGNRLKAEIVLNEEEQGELGRLIESAARRFQRSINSQVLSEIKQELR